MIIDPSAKYSTASLPTFKMLTCGDTFYLLNKTDPNMKIEEAILEGETVNAVTLDTGTLFYCVPNDPIILGDVMIVSREA